MAALVGSELRRLTLLRTPVNKGKKKGRGIEESSLVPVHLAASRLPSPS
jgi:hypothetical protein